jgi:hypothetical protein
VLAELSIIQQEPIQEVDELTANENAMNIMKGYFGNRATTNVAPC